MPDGSIDLDPDPFGALPIAIGVVVVLVFVLIIGLSVYRSVRMARRGQNPLTLPEDVAYRFSRPGAGRPPASKSQRLDELDALRAADRISEAERAEARARILGE